MSLVPFTTAIGEGLATFGGTLATLGGGLATLHGAHYMSGGGNFLNGIRRVFFGLAAIDLGARLISSSQTFHEATRFMSSSQTFHERLIRATLQISTWFIAAKGGMNIVKCIAYENLSLRCLDIVQLGIVQLGMGIASSNFIHNIEAKTVAALYEAALFSLIGGFISSLNLKGFGEKGKIFSHIGGIVGAGYHLYQKLVPQQIFSVDPKINKFLNDHIQEIEEMSKNKIATGDWRFLGLGVSKIAFTHPDLPGFLIKIPRNAHHSYWGNAKNEVESNVERLKTARSIVQTNNYKHIVIPQSELFQTKEGPVALEEKLEIVDYFLVADSPEKAEAETELNDFKANGKYCDLWISSNSNCGFLKNKATPQIGVFDLDCIL